VVNHGKLAVRVLGVVFAPLDVDDYAIEDLVMREGAGAEVVGLAREIQGKYGAAKG
jgi:hypothetical protein